MDRDKLARKLRGLREGRGLRLDVVSRESGVHPSMLSRLERGLVERPSIFDVHRLANYYDVPLCEFGDALHTPKLRPARVRVAEADDTLDVVRRLIGELARAVDPAPADSREQQPPTANGNPSANKSKTDYGLLAVARS